MPKSRGLGNYLEILIKFPQQVTAHTSMSLFFTNKKKMRKDIGSNTKLVNPY